MLAIIDRREDMPLSTVPVLPLARAMSEETVVFSDTLTEKEAKQGAAFASFHLRTGDAIRPVAVTCTVLDGVRAFHIPDVSPPVFAAAVTALMGELLQRENRLPRMLHFFNAGGALAARLCKMYYRIPFVFSVNGVRENTAPLQELTALGLHLPAGCARLGTAYLPEQAAALEAEYIIDEQAGDCPRSWSRFYAMFPGKVIWGLPVVDTDFWAAQPQNGLRRRERKDALLASYNRPGNILVLSNRQDVTPEGIGQDDVCVMRLAAEPLRQREQLQAADFFLAEDSSGQPALLLASLAAGCIPVTEKSGFAATALVDAQDDPDRATAYLYHDNPSRLEGLSRAIRDYRENPGLQQALRQRGSSCVREKHSPVQAARLYERVYRGLGPVRLPFVAAGQNLAPGAHLEEQP